jgi:starvation-inducible DNA-binding protein
MRRIFKNWLTTARILKPRGKTPLNIATTPGATATKDISSALNALLADIFCLFMKTKNFHWHVSGPYFRDYHLLFDEQAVQLFGMTDEIAERVRKIGGTTLRSIGHIGRLQRLPDNDAAFVDPQDMLSELHQDNQRLAASLRTIRDLCDAEHDMGTASLLDAWIDEAERRIWFLYETSRRAS